MSASPSLASSTPKRLRKDMQAEVAEWIREIFNAPSRAMAEQQLKALVNGMAARVPWLAIWLKKSLPEGFTVFAWRKLRMSNVVERLNREIRRRGRVVSIFPNETACLRLISAVLMEQDEVWATGRLYLRFEGIAGGAIAQSGSKP